MAIMPTVVEWGREAAELANLTVSDEEQIKALGLSEFLARMASRNSEEFQRFLAEKTYVEVLLPSDIEARVATLESEFPVASAQASGLAEFQRAVRMLRYEIQRLVVWRHLTQRATHAETVAALSVLADSLLEITLAWCDAAVARTEGEPFSETGRRQRLAIFALGKLGGRELNLSSDVDLVCAYPESGKTAKTGKTNQQFFVQVMQLLLKALGETTGDGFGFRVDLRLRPYGDSGPIVQPFAAMERYFETSGRDWERYALIKARACAGEIEAGAALLERLRPFVYRRYLDFAAIESMREMRMQIRRDHGAHADNVKLCAGGIRDVEFLVQMLQLIWGGRIESLRTNSLASAMDALVAENLLAPDEREALWSSYEFSRDVEHCLQAFRDEQTHSLPATSQDRLRLASALGFPDFDAMKVRLAHAHEAVLNLIEQWLSSEDVELPVNEPFLPALSQEAVAGRSLQVIVEIRAAARRAPEGLVHERLERLLPLLLEDLQQCSIDTPDVPLDVVLLRLEPLLKNVLRRSAYLVLLSENAEVRMELVKLAGGGEYFTGLLAKFPALLEELFMRINLAAVPDLEQLRCELDTLLPAAVAADLQQQHFDQLAQYKTQHQFRCLLALSRGDLTLMQMADYLTRLAESVVEVLLGWAWVGVRDGGADAQPNDSRPVPKDYLVIGYGKLGGLELGGGSDLDLVFIHDHGLEHAGTFHQLTRRLLSYLSVQTYFGPLYEADIRLRPAGRDGTLVSTMDGFETYQASSAWLWEHQALVRARVVAGCSDLAERFDGLRRATLGVRRDLGLTRQHIVEMREKMRRGIAVNTRKLRLKQGDGGIVDIEFMVQYLVLGWSAEYPGLLDFTDNARILERAAEYGLVSKTIARQLASDYASLRHKVQLLIVSPSPAIGQNEVESEKGKTEQERVAALWQQMMIQGLEPAKLSLSV